MFAGYKPLEATPARALGVSDKAPLCLFPQEIRNVKRFLTSLFAVAILAATAMHSPARALAAEDTSKPVAVLSIASYDRIMADVAMFGELAGNPDLAKNLEGMLKLFTQGQGLAGLDQTRPWCVTVLTDDVSFQPLAYLPVDDVKKLLESLAGLIGEAEEAGDGVYALNVFGQEIVVKEVNKWAIVAQTLEAVTAAPAEPATLLAGMDTSYDVAIRLYVQNIPEVYRSLAIDQLRMGVESGLGRMPDEDDKQYEARRAITEKQLERADHGHQRRRSAHAGRRGGHRRQDGAYRLEHFGRARQQVGQADGANEGGAFELRRIRFARRGRLAQHHDRDRQG